MRSAFTPRGYCGLAPWNESATIYSVGQLYLGTNHISKLEVISSLNINNMSRGYIWYNSQYCALKYNPRVYLGLQTSVSYAWSSDTPYTPTHSWPESFDKKYNSPMTYGQAKR